MSQFGWIERVLLALVPWRDRAPGAITPGDMQRAAMRLKREWTIAAARRESKAC